MKNEKKNITLSYSHFHTYLQCKRKFYNMYILDEKISSPSVFNLLGDSVHKTIQTYFNIINKKELENKYQNFKQKELDYKVNINEDEINLEKIFFHYLNFIYDMWKNEWGELIKFFINDDFLQKLIVNIKYLLKEFEKNFDEYFKNIKYLTSEHKIKINLKDFFEYYSNYFISIDFKKYENIDFVGYIDMLFERNDEIIIYDIKVPYKKWTKNDYKKIEKISQPVLYYLILSYINKKNNKTINFKYLFFNIKNNDIKIMPLDIDNNLIKNILTKFKDFVDEIYDFENKSLKENESFYIKNLNMCEYCPYKYINLCDSNT